MSISTTAHINLRGTAREALEFYRSVFGGDLVAATYADAGAAQDPAEADQIIWGQVTSPDGFRIMAFDVPAARPWNPGEHAYYVSVRGTDAGEVTAYWKKLSDGSTVLQDLAPSGWSPLYGMLTDRFGVTWVLDVAVGYS
ncbi:VOC family protein [Virgisporangium ochraceum]|uniref:VOC family protein n=1 Tax=Virgisporangium ochraceum TaxID=65505 RepID=A0A8J4A4K6_9ACTN|nr:VOC family protein [Virgisporangium ochraceum]GIJ73265.1 VOC family protein [Virgisporangium ochraceum]